MELSSFHPLKRGERISAAVRGLESECEPDHKRAARVLWLLGLFVGSHVDKRAARAQYGFWARVQSRVAWQDKQMV